MNDARHETGWVRAVAVFAASVGAIFCLPYVAFGAHRVLPSLVTNTLYFFPQFAFPFRWLVIREEFGTHTVLSPHVGQILNVALWTLVATAFAFFARGVRFRYLLPLAVGAIVVVVVLVNLSFGLFGVRVELDGP